MGSLKNVLVSSLVQFWWFIGIFVALSVVLYFIARVSRRTYASVSKGNIDIYVTGWIGTPVHEFGHWLFCIIFGHKIKEVRFFKPDTKSGTLGYVAHSYDKKSYYQQVGNFFIGVGPVLIGTLALSLLAYLLLPNSRIAIKLFSDFVSGWPIEVSYGSKSALNAIVDNFVQIYKVVLVSSNLKALVFWLFIYLSVCISSHMMLSTADMKQAFFGALVLLAAFILLNGISEVFHLFSKNSFAESLSNRVTLMALKTGAASIFFLSYSLLMSLVNLSLAFLLKCIAYVVKR